MKTMREFLAMFLAIVFITSIVLTPANAADYLVSSYSNESIDSVWKANCDYPVTPADAEWKSLSYSEQLKICDMPLEMLSKCSTEQLGDLVLNYPLLCDILAFNSTDLALRHLINTSNICKEFFSRDNITELLIEKYDQLYVDYDELMNASNATSLMDSGYMAELFLQTYFAHKFDSLTDIQVQEVTKIINDKHIAKKGICDNFSTSFLIYDWLQTKNGYIPQSLISQEIEHELISKGNLIVSAEIANEPNQTRVLPGFTPSNYYIQLDNYGVYRVGTYTLYGVTVGCYEYFTYDFDEEEADLLNDAFDAAHPSWTRVYSCTVKYNCHSYTWIESTNTNIYWLNNPDAFADSSAFSSVGYSFNTSPSRGDKIIICGSMSIEDGFDGYTYALHSANVLSSNGSTQSKLGSYGVYIVPAEELLTYYDGFYYEIFR